MVGADNSSNDATQIQKGPACRQADESYDECVSRKIPELIEMDGMKQDQAIAVAKSMCETKCSEKATSGSLKIGDWASWTTSKGVYVGKVGAIQESGEISVATSEGGSERIEASPERRVIVMNVYVNNEDGSYSRSDRMVPVAESMLRNRSEPEIKSVAKKVTDQVRKTLKKKAEDHNKKVGDAKTKRTTTRTLGSVFLRGVGAYRQNPQSVRPTVNSAEQWAYARVNSFLYVLRNGRFRGGKHDTDLLPKGHPHSTKSIDTNTRTKRTDFPSKGDDKKISLRNSKWPIFPSGYAADLKSDWPKIWGKGGNILGNTQYSRLTKVLAQGGSAKTPTDEKAIRLREAWMARHYRDHRLAGVVAQIKWLGIGSRGLDHMKKVINDEKKRLRKSANREEPHDRLDEV